MKFDWTKLSSIQLGRYAEYFVKMEFTLLGFDVYEPEIDDKGIDFIIRKDLNKFYEIQVKSVYKASYIFITKNKFQISDIRYVAIVLFTYGEPPELYLIPSSTWFCPNEIFVSRDYEGKKSSPEWGINLSKKNLPKLLEYKFDNIAKKL